MINGSAVLLGELLVGVLIGTLIGAVILKVFCALYNVLASTSAKSSSPPTLRAAGSEPETKNKSEAVCVLPPTNDRVVSDLPPTSDWSDHESIEKPSGVPKPSFEWSMCIVFATALVES